ncbi:MAG: hypothetical protein RMI56_06520 [Sulfolobales archaeon]|nr:hypothetical protein [Sulfolobales archaeon]MDW8083428.1 hypothetical protein [Sulfolobales archaeon]
MICLEDGLKCYGSYCSNRLFINYITGRWFDLDKGLSEVEDVARRAVEDVIERFYCLSVSASPWDKFEVLTAAFLSRNTDYHRNTVRWVKSLLHKLSNTNIDSANGIVRAAFLTYNEYRSYQLHQLTEVLSEILSALQAVSAMDVETIRKQLIKIKHLGPKVVDSFLLHSGLETIHAPVDIHYLRFLKKYGLLRDVFTYPRKKYCTEFNCYTCPIARKCVYAYTIKMFKNLNGFIQTASYVSGKLKVESCRDLGGSNLRSLLEKITAS